MAGLYIHIPFCTKKCNYCDFYSIPTNDINLIEEVVSAIIKEMSYNNSKIYNKQIDTIYIGGGTPNYLPIKQLDRLLSYINDNINMNYLKEFTIECNPEFIDEDKVKLFINKAINRISMGIQSFDDRFLSLLDRTTNSKTVYKAIEIIRKSNIKQFSCDLIFGIPYQKMEDLESDLNKVIDIKPSHISYYGLTIEKETAIYNLVKNKKLPLPDEDLTADMYLNIIDTLNGNNYQQYEISNFCYDNQYSIHNINYWNRGEYYGYGPSASSYYDGIRYKNVESLKAYLTMVNIQTRPATEKIDILGKEQKMEEFVMLSLRKADGLDFIKFYDEFNIDLYELLKEKLPDLVNNERLMVFNKNIIRLKSEGFLIYDYIIEEISHIIWEIYRIY